MGAVHRVASVRAALAAGSAPGTYLVAGDQAHLANETVPLHSRRSYLAPNRLGKVVRVGPVDLSRAKAGGVQTLHSPAQV